MEVETQIKVALYRGPVFLNRGRNVKIKVIQTKPAKIFWGSRKCYTHPSSRAAGARKFFFLPPQKISLPPQKKCCSFAALLPPKMQKNATKYAALPPKNLFYPPPNEKFGGQDGGVECVKIWGGRLGEQTFFKSGGVPGEVAVTPWGGKNTPPLPPQGFVWVLLTLKVPGQKKRKNFVVKRSQTYYATSRAL